MGGKDRDAAEGHWLANKYVISIVLFFISVSAVGAYKVADAYNRVQSETEIQEIRRLHDKEIQELKNKQMTGEIAGLRKDVKVLLTSHNKLMEEILRHLRSSSSAPKKSSTFFGDD